MNAQTHMATTSVKKKLDSSSRHTSCLLQDLKQLGVPSFEAWLWGDTATPCPYSSSNFIQFLPGDSWKLRWPFQSPFWAAVLGKGELSFVASKQPNCFSMPNPKRRSQSSFGRRSRADTHRHNRGNLRCTYRRYLRLSERAPQRSFCSAGYPGYLVNALHSSRSI